MAGRKSIFSEAQGVSRGCNLKIDRPPLSEKIIKTSYESPMALQFHHGRALIQGITTLDHQKRLVGVLRFVLCCAGQCEKLSDNSACFKV